MFVRPGAVAGDGSRDGEDFAGGGAVAGGGAAVFGGAADEAAAARGHGGGAWKARVGRGVEQGGSGGAADACGRGELVSPMHLAWLAEGHVRTSDTPAMSVAEAISWMEPPQKMLTERGSLVRLYVEGVAAEVGGT